MKCDECGSLDDVNTISTFWSCGGAGVGFFEWRKFEGEDRKYCQNCESEAFDSCSECGCWIDSDCMFGAEELAGESDFIGHRCPGCKKIMEY